MTRYTLYVSMGPETADKLYDKNYVLYLMRAVQTSDKGEASIWISSPMHPPSATTGAAGLADDLVQTEISWIENYVMYTSRIMIPGPGKVIRNINTYAANLGDTLEVTKSDARGEIKVGKKPGPLVFYNSVQDSGFSCGLCTYEDKGDRKIAHPYNAFPFPGRQKVELTPIIKILAFFSTDSYDSGTVLEKTGTDGALIDFTDADNQERVAVFDFNKGWSNGGGKWLTTVKAIDIVAEYLIIGKK